MNDDPNFTEQLLSKLSPQDRRDLNSIIADLKASHTNKLEALMASIINKLLSELEGGSVELDLSSLTSEQQAELEQNLQDLLGQLQSHTKYKSKADVVKLVMQVLMQHFKKQKDRQSKKHKENDLEHLTEKQLEDLKEQTKRFIIYEFYKFTNPRRLAGETAKDNFVNNAINKGVKYALKFSGAEELQKMSAGDVSHLEQLHQQYKGMSR